MSVSGGRSARPLRGTVARSEHFDTDEAGVELVRRRSGGGHARPH